MAALIEGSASVLSGCPLTHARRSRIFLVEVRPAGVTENPRPAGGAGLPHLVLPPAGGPGPGPKVNPRPTTQEMTHFKIFDR